MRKIAKLSSQIIQKAYNQEISGVELDGVKELTDKDGRTLLFHAVSAKNEELLQDLINRKADINHFDNFAWTALHYAVQNHLIEIAKFLIANGANVNAQDKNGNSVLWRATFESKGRGEMISLLLANGAISTLKNNYDVSPIDLARTIANYNIEQFFI